jgi:hypothetical protein
MDGSIASRPFSFCCSVVVVLSFLPCFESELTSLLAYFLLFYLVIIPLSFCKFGSVYIAWFHKSMDHGQEGRQTPAGVG